MSTATGLAPLRTYSDPFRMMEEKMNRLFEETFGPLAFPRLTLPVEEAVTGWVPFCDVYETENEIVVKAELPEVKKENVKVSIVNNALEISGERKFSEEIKRENYQRIERSYGQFLRRFMLPVAVEPNRINAEFKDGVLRVILPKSEEAKPKAIEVNIK
jgi:HSP20 family protein